jgi:hypothetical protein
MSDDTRRLHLHERQARSGIGAQIHGRRCFRAVKSVAHTGDAIETGKPGMPLDVLSNLARETPLGSLLIAFLLGIAVARRR